MKSALTSPDTDPSPVFEHFRGIHATELLTAAVEHFDVFGKLRDKTVTRGELREQLELGERPFVVLTTALKAMGLLTERDGSFVLTPMALEHLVPGGEFYVGDYIRLAGENPSVLAMVERLKTDRPAGSEPEEGGAAYIYREDIESKMEDEAAARFLTLALSGRARNCAPRLAERLDLEGRRLVLDVGGGSGIYAIALCQRNPELRAVVWERPEVLKVAAEMAAKYAVADRIESLEGDMFVDEVPEGVDVILLSNILHDWDVPECRTLIERCATALPEDGALVIHDVFLSDDLDGPLPIALYSAALFSLTEGRAYSEAEYRAWLADAGLEVVRRVDTMVHCGALVARKPR